MENAPAHKTPASLSKAPKAPRISSKIRTAVTERVEKGITIEEACRAAGLSPAGWYKAMKRPEVQAFVDDVMAKYIRGAEAMKARHKARAIEIAAHLMENAASEAVRMRAVEFFAAEPKSGAAVNVQVNVDRGGYEYVKPGQKVVEIVEASVSTSDASNEESSQ